MRVTNHVPDLLAAKFGAGDEVDLRRVASEANVGLITVRRWSKRELRQIDIPTLAKWCKYFNCQPGDILKYEE